MGNKSDWERLGFSSPLPFAFGEPQRGTSFSKICLANFEKLSGAGEGNRTLTASLEGWNSTVELHPQDSCK